MSFILYCLEKIAESLMASYPSFDSIHNAFMYIEGLKEKFLHNVHQKSYIPTFVSDAKMPC